MSFNQRLAVIHRHVVGHDSNVEETHETLVQNPTLSNTGYVYIGLGFGGFA